MTNGSTNQHFGWALIGCGGIGNWHARWATETPDIDVRGFCDIRPEAAAKFHDQHGGDFHTDDLARVLEDPTIEVVTIATSHGSHAELALAALAAGKHVYLEKPMAMTVADCLKIYEAMLVAGTKIMINFSIRSLAQPAQ